MISLSSIITFVGFAACTANAAVFPRCTDLPSTPYTEPTTLNHTFGLQAIAHRGETILFGMFAEYYHDGPASSWITMDFINSVAGNLAFNNATGDIYTPGSGNGDIYSLDFSGLRHTVYPETWPAGDNFMGVTDGMANSGFTFNATTNQVLPRSYPGRKLAVCPAKSYASGNPTVYSLMWKESNTTRNNTCAEGVLKAVLDF